MNHLQFMALFSLLAAIRSAVDKSRMFSIGYLLCGGLFAFLECIKQ